MNYLYKLTNLINNKIYIGQTNNPSLRWSQHKSNAKYNRGDQVITRAISKYGHESFNFEVIATCITKDYADEVEMLIITQYDSRNLEKGYNISAGGNTSPRTPEILQKISESLKKYYETNDGWNKGGSLTDEWKNKISESHMGLIGTNAGKTFDDKWKFGISKSLAGKEKKSKRRFSEEIEKEICRLYIEEERSTYWLGIKFDCGRNLIISILDRNNILKRQSNYTGHLNNCNIFSLDQEDEICKVYLLGNISRSDLAKQFNCGKTTIRHILLRHSIKL